MNRILFLIVMTWSVNLYSQNIAINESGAAADQSAILDISSSDKGILLPRLKTSQRKGINMPQTGLLVYDVDIASLFYYDGSDWVEFASSRNGLQDGDQDTKVIVEKEIDDDSVRIVTAGLEKVIFHTAGIAYDSDNRNLALGSNIREAGNNNLLIGHHSNLHNSISPEKNVVIGNGTLTLFNSANDDENVVIGHEAGSDITSGSRNVVVGFESFQSGSGNSNVSIGSNSGNVGNGIGERNVFIGQSAGSSESGIHLENIAIGSFSGRYAEGSSTNISIGKSAGFNNSEASNNKIALGNNAGRLSIRGDNSIFIGKNAGSSMSLCNDCVVIGSNAGSAGFFNNSLMIDNETTLSPLIHGNFASDRLEINGDLDVVHKNDGSLYGFKVTNSVGGNYWKFYTRSSNGNLRLYNSQNANYVAWIDSGSGSYNTVSDYRMKKDLEPLQSVISSLMNLTVYKYRFITEDTIAEKEIGLIAQEVDRQFPELVEYDSENDLYTLNYSSIAPIAIKGIQELHGENIELQDKIALLNAELTQLRKEFQNIKVLLEKEY